MRPHHLIVLIGLMVKSEDVEHPMEHENFRFSLWRVSMFSGLIEDTRLREDDLSGDFFFFQMGEILEIMK
jgi:hypothetical protein